MTLFSSLTKSASWFSQLIAEINVTPLVDVMLVLLIIFMVAAPMMTSGIDVKLPSTSTQVPVSDEERITVTLALDNKVYVNNDPVEFGELQNKLAAISQNGKDHKGVSLRADEKIPYGSVVEVMGAIRHAGLDRIGMITEPLNKGRAP